PRSGYSGIRSPRRERHSHSGTGVREESRNTAAEFLPRRGGEPAAAFPDRSDALPALPSPDHHRPVLFPASISLHVAQSNPGVRQRASPVPRDGRIVAQRGNGAEGGPAGSPRHGPG